MLADLECKGSELKAPITGLLIYKIRFLGLYKLMVGLFNGLYKLFGRFESRNEMLRDLYSNILLDVTTDLGRTFLQDETTETADVNRFPFDQRSFHFFEESLQGYQDVNFRNAGFFGNAGYNISFSHVQVVF